MVLNFTVLLLATIYFIAHLLYWSYFDPLLSYISSSSVLEGIYFLNTGISKNISVLPSTWIQIRLVREQLFLLAQHPSLPFRNHLSSFSIRMVWVKMIPSPDPKLKRYMTTKAWQSLGHMIDTVMVTDQCQVNGSEFCWHYYKSKAPELPMANWATM